MTIPLWILIGFVAWTLVTLLAGVGISRWTQILSGRAQLTGFPGDIPHGSPRYRRAMRAHANCVENLPVYTAVVVVIVATGTTSPTLDLLAIVFFGARIVQTLVHILPDETNTSVGLRFSFFFIQLVCVAWMGVETILEAA